MASRDETGGDGKPDRAASTAVDEIGVATTDSSEDGRHALDGLDLVVNLSEAGLLGHLSGLGFAAGNCLKHELVGSDVDVVGGDTACGLLALAGGEFHGVDGSLGRLKLLDGSVDEHGSGTGISNGGSQSCVSDGNAELAVLEPSTTESGAGRALECLDDVGGSDLTGNTSVSLSGVESKIALHGSQNVGVKSVGGGSGSAIDDGQEDCQSSEERVELHIEGLERSTRKTSW